MVIQNLDPYKYNVGVLGGELGEGILKKVHYDYKDYPIIADFGKIIKKKDKKTVIGDLNPFLAIAINKRLEMIGKRIATHSEIWETIQQRKLLLKGYYLEGDLALRSEEKLNSYLSQCLIDDMVGMHALEKFPMQISLNNLRIKKDKDSCYGLVFRLKEDAEILHSPILNKDSSAFYLKDMDKTRGLPQNLTSEENSSRKRKSYFYGAKEGLTRIVINSDSQINSGLMDFRCSGDNGRIIVVG